MPVNPKQTHRRSSRLRGYDYAEVGAYFVTICTQERRLLFENRPIRTIAQQCWLEIPAHFSFAELDEWYERVIRTERDLNQIRQYILDNPTNWH
jgi:REP-associated tyrosine transposase